ncbi:MAG TPA: metal-dependent hydrolase [Dehalococcoidia bacterium]|jgi:membrane-bound metal-dependent hydrolase YbcI (DUF457 family)|nr:metal-dependent hydrolase [Dehalococcoidia bacterium]
MATPLGHTLLGLTLARRLGVRSPFGMAAAVVAASWPDIDVIAGIVLHRDPWKLHRQHTHTLGFALSSGMLAGFAGLVSAGHAEGERDLIADSMTGALIVGSHVLLDKTWFPYLPTKKGMPRDVIARNSRVNWLLDAAFYGVLAWKLWPREAPPAAR